MSDLFLRACRREPVERTPVWLMRQAGRALPEYREVRSRVDFLTLCRTPELAAKVTLQPVDRLGVDAAILFSDILIPAEPMGFKVEFNPAPVLDNPVRTAADVERIRTPSPEETVPYVYDTLRILRRELDGRVPVIGFGAAPFTLAVYLVEGQGSKSFGKIKGLLYSDPVTAEKLLDKVATMTAAYLTAQVHSGAQAIQLFDSWAGILGAPEFRRFALAHARRVADQLKPLGVPLIYFALNSGHLFEEIRQCGCDVAGVDWRTPLSVASEILGDRFAVQGNLDPCVLLGTPEVVAERASAILTEGASLPGHVFNLGHGVLPETPVENLQALVDAVRGYRKP